MMLMVLVVCSFPGLVTAVSPSATVFSLRYVNNNNKTFNMNFNFTSFSEFQRCLTDEAIYSCTLQSSKVTITTLTTGVTQTNITGVETIKSTQPTTSTSRKSCNMSSYKLSFFEYYFSIQCSVSDNPCERELAIDFVRDEATSRCGYACWDISGNILFVYSAEMIFFRCDPGPHFTLPIESNGDTEMQLTSATVRVVTDSSQSDVASSTTTVTSTSNSRPVTMARTTYALSTTTSTSIVPTTTSTSIVPTMTSTSIVPTTTSIYVLIPPPPTTTEAETGVTTKVTILPTAPQPTTTITQNNTPPADTPKPSTATPPMPTTPQHNTTPRPTFSSLTSNIPQPISTRSPTTLAASTTTTFQQFPTMLPSTTSEASITVTSSLNTDDNTKAPTNPSKLSTAEQSRPEPTATTLIVPTANNNNTSETFTPTLIPNRETETSHTSSSSSYTASSTINQVAYPSSTLKIALADSDTNNNSIVIALSVIVSFLALATAVIFLYLFLQRRRQKRTLRDNESTRVLRADDSMDLNYLRTQRGEESHYSSVIEYDPPWGGQRGNVTPDLISSCEGSSSSDTAKKPTVPDSSTIPRPFDEYSRLHLPSIVKNPEAEATNTTPGVAAIYDNVRLQDLEPIYNLSSFSDDLNDGGNQTSTPKRDADTGRMLKFHDVNPYSVVVLDPTLFNTSNHGTSFLKKSNPGESSSNKFIILDSVSNDRDGELNQNSGKLESKNVTSRMYVATKDYSDHSEIESDCLSVSATSSFNLYSGKNAVESPKEDTTLPARTPNPGKPLRFVFPAELL
ncbi:unnamed protein product [Lymnaea stagnalis]|uniref:Uncharacterized protein n=1 Tax=Lymnaea stagnalis TaxID=6523 RepID=A0AAV2H5X9_LYMST